ncbi:MAG: HEAT repeat domain-containing protein [Actinomycetota bacterium]
MNDADRSSAEFDRRLNVVLAGYRGDDDTVRDGLVDPDPLVRVVALGAAQRRQSLNDGNLASLIDDPDHCVRRRVAELAARHPGLDLMPLLHDDDASVVEMAAWACGEHPSTPLATLDRLVHLAVEHADPLVREAAVAALGAIGDERGLPAILHGCSDKPAIRRRAVLALAPFSGPEVDAAIATALEDRDWQVRQSAEDIQP